MEYECAVVRRGDVTLWPPQTQGGLGSSGNWSTRRAPAVLGSADRAALMLRLVFRLALRQTAGFVGSMLTLMRAALDAPDVHDAHPTVSGVARRTARHPG